MDINGYNDTADTVSSCCILWFCGSVLCGSDFSLLPTTYCLIDLCGQAQGQPLHGFCFCHSIPNSAFHIPKSSFSLLHTAYWTSVGRHKACPYYLYLLPELRQGMKTSAGYVNQIGNVFGCQAFGGCCLRLNVQVFRISHNFSLAQ